MPELLKITKQNFLKPAVSALELYNFLEVKTEFEDWITNILSSGFEEGFDFSSFLGENPRLFLSNGTSKDYALTIHTAKEIAMMQGTDKGKQARQYLIELGRVV